MTIYSSRPIPILGYLTSLLLFAPLYAAEQTVADEQAVLAQLLELSLTELMEVEVTTIATGSAQTTAQAPAVTSVISAEDIQKMGAANLGDVLRSVPGFHVRRSGVFYQDTYAIRGISSGFNPEVLLLIDGIPVNSLTIGGSRRPFWDAPLLRDIARIEVVRGPGSALYGADAYSGVVNIISKTTKDIKGTEGGVRGGSFSSGEAWLLHGGEINGFDVSFSLQTLRTSGHEEIIERDKQTVYDELTGTHASIAPGDMNLNRRALDTRLQVGKGNWLLRTAFQGRYDVGRGVSTDPSGLIQDQRFDANLTWHNPKLTEHWDVQAQVSYQTIREWPQNDLLSYPPGAARKNPDGSLTVYPNGMIFSIGLAEHHSRLETSAFYTGIKNHKIRIGAGFHYVDAHDMATSTNIGPDPRFPPGSGKLLDPTAPPLNLAGTWRGTITPTATRHDQHIYIQDIWAFAPGWELTAGLRYDDYSDFGATTNPRLALVKQVSEALTAKFLYGKAFRAPSINELYVGNNDNIKGSINLQPESIDTFELAAEWQVTEKLRLAGNVFYYQAQDKILFAPLASNPSINSVAQNLGEQNGKGFELELRWKINKYFNMLASYSYVDTQNELTGSPLGNDPSQQAYLRGDWRIAPKWHVYPQLTWVGERERVTNDTRPALSGYTELDLITRYGNTEKSGGWSLSAGVRNLLDEDLRDPAPYETTEGKINVPGDHPLPGRNWFVEMNYRF